MKLITLTTLLTLSLQLHASEHILKSHGAATDPFGCALSSVLEEEALADALKNAGKICERSRLQPEQVNESRILTSFRGSCWGMTPSTTVVSIDFKCVDKKTYTCDFDRPQCPTGYHCNLGWREGPFECIKN